MGTHYLQVCPASQGGHEGPGNLAPSCALLILRLREQREGQLMSLQAPKDLLSISRLEWWEDTGQKSLGNTGLVDAPGPGV